MRCLEKDRKRRYDGANDLAKDVERYLADEQVEACPPTLSYQFRKTFQKHRRAILTVATFAAVLLVATITSFGFALSARRAERLAKASAKEAKDQSELAKQAKRTADQSALEAKAVTDFLVQNILAAADPYEGGAYDITVKEVLDQSVERLDKQFPDNSLVAATIKLRLGEILSKTKGSLRDLTGADLAQSAYQIRKEQLGEDHPDTLDALEVGIDLALGNYQVKADEAKDLVRLRQLTMGDGHPDTLRARGRLLWFQTAFSSKFGRQAPEQQQVLDIESDFEQLVKTQRELLGEDHPDVEQTMHWQASTYHWLGHFDSAVAKYERCIELCSQLRSQQNRRLLANMKGLYAAHLALGNIDKCVSLLDEMSVISDPLLGPLNLFNNTLVEQKFAILVDHRRFKDAIAFLKQEIELGGHRRAVAEQDLAILYAWMNDGEAHKKFCQQLLTVYAKIPVAGFARYTSRNSLIYPHEDPDFLEQARAMVKRAHSLNQEEGREFDGWTIVAEAMAEYRLGNFENANEILSSLASREEWETQFGGGRWPTTAIAFQAMCEHRLGNAEKAAERLATAKTFVEGRMTDLYDGSPRNVLIAQLAYREARQLIEGRTSDN